MTATTLSWRKLSAHWSPESDSTQDWKHQSYPPSDLMDESPKLREHWIFPKLRKTQPPSAQQPSTNWLMKSHTYEGSVISEEPDIQRWRYWRRNDIEIQREKRKNIDDCISEILVTSIYVE